MLSRFQHRRRFNRASERVLTPETLEARLVPVTTSLNSGLWSIALDEPGSYAIVPDVVNSGNLLVVANGISLAETTVATTGVTQIQVTGSSGNDVINASALTRALFVSVPALSILSGGGDDSVTGGSGLATSVDGGDGNDTVRGFFGDDTFVGGNGNDILDGASGRDILRGLAGNDTLIGQAGDDALYGGAGRDSILGGAGNDISQGQGGSGDYIDGGPGNDSLSGGEGNDVLNGGTGNDLLDGQAGDDVVTGDGGNDLLLGSEGNDSLLGALGRDLVIGGVGADSVNGGDDEDIVMGAGTNLSLNELLLARNRWGALEPYRLRVTALTTGSSPVRLVPGTTVVEDGVLDTVCGGVGRDWLMRPIDGYTDLDNLADRTRDESFNLQMPIARAEVRPSGHGSAALEKLIPEDTVTHAAIASGNWSDAAIWSTGTVPGTDAIVMIADGTTVTIDGVFTERVAGIVVHGTMRFATDCTTQLTVDTLIVHEGGRFEMGTAENPISSSVTATLLIADRGAIDRERDIFALGRGVLAESTVSIHGSAKTAFRTLQTAVGVGSTRLRLNGGVPADWKVGDRLVLAGTSFAASEDEQLALLGIDGDAVLVRPLAFGHLLPATTAPLERPLQIHLANLSRNAIVRSESTALDRRGHVMFMHMDDVEIEYGAFLDLGRTDKKVRINDVLFDNNDQVIAGTGTNPRGRYAIHFHRAGVVNDGQAALVRGSVVERSPGWGFTNHSSSVNFEDNVSYDVDGSGFATEAGDEIGSFVRNLAIRGKGSNEDHNSRYDIQDFGHQGDGFWIQGGGVNVEDNAASGMNGNGFILYTRGLIEADQQDDSLGFDRETRFLASNLEFPEVALDATTAEVWQVGVRHFKNNEAYGSNTAITFEYVNSPLLTVQKDNERSPGSVRSIIENPTVWNSRIGIDSPHMFNTDINNAIVIGRVTKPTGYGIRSHLGAAGVTYRNAHVEGWVYGLTMPRRGVNLVEDGYFNNIEGITNISIQQTATSGTRDEVKGLESTLRNVTFGTLSTTALRGQIQRNVILTSWLQPNLHSFSGIFETSSVLLDFGTFNSQRAYFGLQSANAVLFPIFVPEMDLAWLDKTNQQMTDDFGLTFGGVIAPEVFATSDQVFADIGPLTDRLARLGTSMAARIARLP